MSDIECGLLAPPVHRAWADKLSRLFSSATVGVTLNEVSIPISDQPNGTLAAHSVLLGRYDVCLLLVTPETLAWTRTELASFYGEFPVPIIGLTRRLRAAGASDLFELGMCDFLCDPADLEELKARIVRAQILRRGPRIGRQQLEKPQRRPPADPKLFIETSTAPIYDINVGREPFKQAKARVVEAFERSYIEGLLARHQGNISQAARAANKNRRAFWQLMRKYEIDATGYRADHAEMAA